MVLPEISPEQKDIIQKLNDKNLIIDSVAGSGKTTTNIYIAKNYLGSRILLLTYNAKLKVETRTRIKELGITNLECHSYHSFCVKYYYDKCYTDTEIKQVTTTNMMAKNRIAYDIIILDEAQDITKLYYELICKINYDNEMYAKICLLGDRYQSIYAFNGADERYLTYADQLCIFNELEWDKCNLNISFRITNTMSEFINKCMLKTDRIRAHKHSEYKPRYIICKVFPNNRTRYPYYPYQEIKYYLNMGYKPNEIFVLAPSIKSDNCPARLLENYIKTKLPNIPIYVPTSDDTKIDEKIIENKLIFSTYHQSKGLERKVVIVFGFDEGYFKYNKPNVDKNVCPNELYVACTRALEHLTLIHSDDNGFLPFLCTNEIETYANIIGHIGELKRPTIKNTIDTQVTNLVKHLSTEIIDECIKYLEITTTRKPCKKIKVKQRVTEVGTTEEVSEINGIAIPAYYEYQKTGNMGILDWCIKPNIEDNQKNEKLIKFWNEYVEDMRRFKENDDIKENLLRIASFYCSLRSGYIFKSKQLTTYDWIDDNILQECMDSLNCLCISSNAKYEEMCISKNDKNTNRLAELSNRKLCGCIDCIDGENIYEFKCVNKLDKTHILQLAIYMYMHMVSVNEKNIITEKNIISTGITNIKQTDNISYLHEDIKETGIITKIYKNGNISIRNTTSKQTHKIQKNNILHNLTYEEEQMPKVCEYKYILYNILTRETIEIKCELSKIKRMIEYLIYNKYANIKSVDDTEFINNSKNIYSKYYE
jgi:hypothetical protein